ncbi:hypothetical protein [Enterococcus faecium]|nr:hypothetical protein [Enterococcus faecium]
MREKHYFNQDRNFWINVQQNDVLAVKNGSLSIRTDELCKIKSESE